MACNDINKAVRRHRALADSTLYKMKKSELVDYVRELEENYNVALSYDASKVKIIDDINAVKLGLESAIKEVEKFIYAGCPKDLENVFENELFLLKTIRTSIKNVIDENS